ncbi:MAG: PqqD family protein [Gammaproteobacteria bacterium]|nr:PqqD family protein [Gammaproteobacteria bacterium]
MNRSSSQLDQPLRELLKDRRIKALLTALDRLAEADQLAMVTTKVLARLSRVSEGVMFRLLPNKQSVFLLWMESRCKRLNLIVNGMPQGRQGLLNGLRNIASDSALLSLLFAPPMVDETLRLHLLRFRDDIWAQLFARIEILPNRPLGIPSRVLMDSVWQNLARMPRAIGSDYESQESEMSQLPWEENAMENPALPNSESVKRLALNDNGFVFDPVSGHSFSVNDSGLILLKLLQEGLNAKTLVQRVVDEYEADAHEVERDLMDFSRLLKGQLK